MSQNNKGQRPSRNRTVTVVGGPQGPHATLTVFMPTVDASMAYQRELNIHKESGDVEAQELSARSFLAAHVVSWNWVDDEGNDLPLPSDDLSVIGQLTAAELKYVGDAVRNGNGDQAYEKKFLKK